MTYLAEDHYASVFGMPPKQNFCDQYRRILQANERVWLSRGQDNQLAGTHVACLPVSGKRDSSVKAMDDDLPWGMVRGNRSPLGEDQSTNLQHLCLHNRSWRCSRLGWAGAAHVNNFTELRLTNGILVD